MSMKPKQSLRDRLLKYLQKQHGWVASGDLQRLVVQHTDYTPRTAVRRLEELAEEGALEVEYRKGHAFYRAMIGEVTTAQLVATNPARLEWFNSLKSV